MRKILKIAAIVLSVFLVVVITRAIFSPYTAWYFVVPRARLLLMADKNRGGCIAVIIERLCL
jgi:hypothetical protein